MRRGCQNHEPCTNLVANWLTWMLMPMVATVEWHIGDVRRLPCQTPGALYCEGIPTGGGR